MEVAAIALYQKVVDKLFKGLCRGGGSSPGRLATASCKSSPLSSDDFFFLPLFQSFSSFLSLTLSSFPSSSLSLSIISLFPPFILPSFFLRSLSLSLSSCLFFHFSLPLPFSLPSLSFLSFPLPSFSLTFSSLLPIFLSVSLFLTSFFPLSCCVR